MPKASISRPADALTERQRDELAEILRAKRDEIRQRRATAPDDRALETESDLMDAATDLTIESEAKGIALQDAHVLGEIEEALKRMANGRYGISDETGGPIGYARLRAIPWARRTVQEEEQREARARAT